MNDSAWHPVDAYAEPAASLRAAPLSPMRQQAADCRFDRVAAVSTTLLSLSSTDHAGEEGLAAAISRSGRVTVGRRAVAPRSAPARLFGWARSQSSRPALTCIIGARRAWIVPMISSTSIPCR